MSSVAVAKEQYMLPAEDVDGHAPDCGHSSLRLTVLFMALVCVGIVMVSSAAGGGRELSRLAGATGRRLLWTGLGMTAFLISSNVNYQFWRRHRHLILALAFLGLVLVLFVGPQINRARRWIRLGPLVGVQPSEFAKVALCIWFAGCCERNHGRAHTFGRGFLLPLAVAASAAMLILCEPDFGTAVLVGVICTTTLLVCGTRAFYVCAASIAALPVVQQLVLGSPYRRARLMSFLDPWADPLGAGYQLIQSKIAIGSGGLFGVGLGAGHQKAGFLPLANNDFIFSTFAEELGFAGSVALIALFVWLLIESLRVTLRARDQFGLALGFGISFLFGLQAALNIAVATGSVPTKGLSLPFLSAGGSSLFFSMFAAGILVNIARSEEQPGRFRLKPWHLDMPRYEEACRMAFRSVRSNIARAFYSKALKRKGRQR